MLLAITLTVLSISSTSVSYAASLDSPLYQLQNGVDPKDIQCNENLVLVLRTDGSPVCVKESSADKLGWEIINTFPVIDTKTVEPTITTLDLSSPVEFVDDGREFGEVLQRMPAARPIYDKIMESMNNGISVNSKGVATITSQAHEKYSINEGVGLYAEDWMPTYIPDGYKLLYSETECYEITGSCSVIMRFVPTTFVLNQNITNYDLQFGKGFYVGAGIYKTPLDEIEDSIEDLKESRESQPGNYGGFRDMTRDGKTVMAYEGGNDLNYYTTGLVVHTDEFTRINVRSNYLSLDELIPVFESIMTLD